MKEGHISIFKQAPQTRAGKWALGLSFISIASGPILGISAAIIIPFIDDYAWSERVSQVFGFSLMILLVVVLLSTLVLSIKAFAHGERSWGVWLALVLSVSSVSFWILMIIGELLLPH